MTTNTLQPPRIPQIILRPDLIHSPRKELFMVVAAIGWAIWLYVISPFFALLAWLFGYQRIDMFILDDPARTLITLQVYAIVITIAGLIFIFWASYNWLRFRLTHRRGLAQTATAGDIGLSFGLTEAQVLFAQQHNTLTFHFND
ncbi:MAG: poly-beta-1,6-N-acetyl-D-glucosamine biosynthesis protein PgaD, partial [Sulfuriferula sp.]